MIFLFQSLISCSCRCFIIRQTDWMCNHTNRVNIFSLHNVDRKTRELEERRKILSSKEIFYVFFKSLSIKRQVETLLTKMFFLFGCVCRKSKNWIYLQNGDDLKSLIKVTGTFCWALKKTTLGKKPEKFGYIIPRKVNFWPIRWECFCLFFHPFVHFT